MSRHALAKAAAVLTIALAVAVPTVSTAVASDVSATRIAATTVQPSDMIWQ